MTAARRAPAAVAAGVAGLAVLAILAVVAVLAVIGPEAVTGTAVRSPAEQLTDSEQIDAVVAAFGTAWNDRDFDALEPIICTGTRASKEFTRDEFLQARNGSGRLSLVVESVEVTGDTATADVSNAGENDQAIVMVREDGEWKWCEF